MPLLPSRHGPSARQPPSQRPPSRGVEPGMFLSHAVAEAFPDEWWAGLPFAMKQAPTRGVEAGVGLGDAVAEGEELLHIWGHLLVVICGGWLEQKKGGR